MGNLCEEHGLKIKELGCITCCKQVSFFFFNNKKTNCKYIS